MEKQFLNKKESAQYLNMSRTTFDKHIKNDRIPYSKIGSRYYFDIEELNKFVEKQRVN